MSTPDKNYTTMLKAARVIVTASTVDEDLKFAAEIIRRSSLAFTPLFSGLEGKDRDLRLAKHVHSALLGMKVPPDKAWAASGLDVLVG